MGKRILVLWALALAPLGCASFANPVADGVPVRRLSSEVLGPTKDGEVTIPLTALSQPQPSVYRVSSGDFLGIWIESVLGAANQPVPISVPPVFQPRDQRRFEPAVGIPVPVSEKGTITLPLIAPLVVQGLTVAEIQEVIKKAYVKADQLRKGNEQVLVSLLQPRVTRALVFRQENTAFTPGPTGSVVPTGKRGTGQLVELYGYENDVLHALSQSGGLPGLDAFNAVIIFRQGFRAEADARLLIDQFQRRPDSCQGLGNQVVRIPLRVRPGMPLPIRPEDVILQEGDVVFLESRDHEVFFTGGLLPSGEHVLPRDRDLDVLEAIAAIRGPLLNGAFGTNNLNGNLVQSGIGFPSPSLLIVIRKLPGGNQIPIRVDLNKALVDRRERLLVQPGDFLLLQEDPSEALARYLSTSFFNFSYTWEVIRHRTGLGVLDFNTPQNVPGRIGISRTNFTTGEP